MPTSLNHLNASSSLGTGSKSQQAQTDAGTISTGTERIPSISLPTGGGAIRGIGEKFATNQVTGTGSMTVPIETSSGRTGFGPQLLLSYDSGAGNGPFGFGWNLSLPNITRKTDKGLPQYLDDAESDVFILSGAEDLVPVLGRDSGPEADPIVHRYRPRIEGLFARIERLTDRASGEVYWRSITKDNITTLYGKTANSRIFDPKEPQHVFTWLICESYDDKGNAIVYEYAEENDAGIDDSQINERKRARSANRYIKRLRYGNVLSRLISSDLKETDWMFEVVFDYDEGHYEELELDSAHPEVEQQRFILASALGRERSWALRPDSFSTYRAGFEIRTHRRCHRVLMFHRFAELGSEPYLVRSTEFDYTDLDYSQPITIEAELAHQGSTRFASFIRSVTQSGFVRDDARPLIERNGIRYQSYLKKSLPALEFEYSKAAIQDEIRELDAGSLEHWPAGLDNSTCKWVDLDGEGVSGILTEQATAWFYKPNFGEARFGALEVVPSIPSLENGRQQFIDLAGDGQLDLAAFAGPSPGFYERSVNTWAPFEAFNHLPNIDWNEPNLRFVDLTGDGHADILITEDQMFTWYPSLGEEGFDSCRYVRKPFDEENGPRLVLADGTQSVYLADMCGDGLSDLVRIRNGEVCYWPNLGYGRFGAKIPMDNAPWFDNPDQFQHQRVQIADIDGSGTCDIIYLSRDGPRLYFNQSGNRWSEPRRLSSFPRVDNISAVMTADLLGNGTACLIWSSPLAADIRRPMLFIDLMGGTKPHLLVKTANNLGAETTVSYAPSTRFYLQDKLAGKPWVTRLPFPVHVVDRVETHDRISRNRFVTRYEYHHGYYDGIEREFRGFGRVDQWDTEQFTATESQPSPANIQAESHVPPIHTITWFHTGAFLEEGRISRQLAHEYYGAPPESDPDFETTWREFEATLLPDTILPTEVLLDGARVPRTLSSDELREASRALKGSVLRQEIYAEDNSPKAQHPYTVSERNYTIEFLQPHGLRNRHAVFFVHQRENIDYHYERNPADARIAHSVTLEVDAFGNVLRSVSVGYPRTSAAERRAEQNETHLTLVLNRFANYDDQVDWYRAGLLVETRTYEVVKPPLTSARFSFAEVRDLMNVLIPDGEHEPPPAKTIPYDEWDWRKRWDPRTEPGGRENTRLRLIEHVRRVYRKDDLTGPVQFGDAHSRALVYESYKLAFTSGLVKRIFVDSGKITAAELAAILSSSSDGGYQPGDALRTTGSFPITDPDGCWWIPSGLTFFSRNSTDDASTELSEARAHFFLPRRFEDPFENSTFVDYDHDLLLTRTEDARHNIASAENDYRTLAPFRMTDPNSNRAEVAFDALGMVVGTAVMGKVGEHKGDLLDDTFVRDLDDATMLAHLTAPLAHPHDILQRATSRMVYDLFAYQRTRDTAQPQPSVVYTLTRETHDADLTDQQTKVQHSFSYSDGFGREIQKKIQAEPGKVPRRDPVTGRIIAVDGQPEMTENDVTPRWVGSGWVMFNNKGKPVRQYEPFFTDTHRFEFDVRIGVSPVLFYDPLERMVAKLHPNNTWEKVAFDPWQQRAYDVNDNVLVTDPKTDGDVGDFFRRLPEAEYLPTWHDLRQSGALGTHEQMAARKAAVHADTPIVTHFDTLGRTFLTIAHNRFKRSDSTDPPTEEFHSTRVTLDIEGNQREVIDARDRVVMRYDYDLLGTRIHQASMEASARWMLTSVAGKPIRGWDSRGHTTRYEYDALHRPTHLFVREGDGDEKLVERLVYGELHPEAPALNLRAKLYQHYDGAGVFVPEAYDFKGNVLSSHRILAKDYKQVVDWSPLSGLTEIDSIITAAAPMLERETFNSTTSYDALNRPVTMTMPDRSVIRPEYNEANLLNAVRARLRGAIEETNFVTNIDYDAKGQRTLVDYGNGAETTYSYDSKTFRLIRLLTIRSRFSESASQSAQNLRYTYDPAGNITHIQDDADLQNVVYFNNQRVEPSADYTYDATYRLIEARGREHLGQTDGALNPPTPLDAWNFFHTGLTHPGDGNAMGNYIEEYSYDQVGNFVNVIHTAAGRSWRRAYDYSEDSLLEPSGAVKSNRLSSTTVGTNGSASAERYSHDEHGNITGMPHLIAMEWDYKDQLHVTQKMVREDGGTGERTYYAYDSSGQRVRKVTENSADLGVTPTRKEERIYLGGFELYRSYTHGATTLERETLHILDDKQRIALVETKTIDATHPVIRYQFSNHLGSASLELDDVGAVISYEEYFPYGSTSYQAVNGAIEVSPKRYRYTGMERDEESGLSYHTARYYAPWLGRWTKTDPVALEAGINLYAYVLGNPCRIVDRSGTNGDGFLEAAEGVAEGLLDLTVGRIRHAYQRGNEAGGPILGIVHGALATGPLSPAYELYAGLADRAVATAEAYQAHGGGVEGTLAGADQLNVTADIRRAWEAVGESVDEGNAREGAHRAFDAAISTFFFVVGFTETVNSGRRPTPQGRQQYNVPHRSGRAVPSLPQMSDRSIAQHHLNNVNAELAVREYLDRGLPGALDRLRSSEGGLVFGNQIESGLARSLEATAPGRYSHVPRQRGPNGRFLPGADFRHMGRGTGRPFADVFPLNRREIRRHSRRPYGPNTDPLMYTRPPRPPRMRTTRRTTTSTRHR